MLTLDPVFLAISASIILVGGVLKGMSGFGLPMVALPVMANFVPAPAALVLLSVPILVTNVIQAVHPVAFLPMVRRFWLFYAAIALGVAGGTAILVTMPTGMLDIVVGCAMIGAGLVRVGVPDFQLRPSAEIWLQPLVGVFAGVLGGVSSMFGPPVIVFMQLLGLSRDEFVVALSLAYLVGLVPMVVALLAHGWVGSTEMVLSCVALLPAFLGMAVGQRFRGAATRGTFHWLIICLLVVSGGNILFRGLLA